MIRQARYSDIFMAKFQIPNLALQQASNFVRGRLTCVRRGSLRVFGVQGKISCGLEMVAMNCGFMNAAGRTQ